MRIGIISLIHESNTFISKPTTIEDFRAETLAMGDDIVARWAATPHEISGFLAGIADGDGEAVPIFSAWASPGGQVDRKTYDMMLNMMLEGLDRAGTLDGLLVAPHGAGVSEEHPDMDGHWLSVVRDRVGPELPIISTLDPHANLSHKMVDTCNATIGYRTNPHMDQRQIGLQAADLMWQTLRGEVRPTQAASFPPIAINIERQTTTDPPCKPMYEFADQMLQRPGVLSNSILLGFAFADVVEMGTSFTVVTDNDAALAANYADELANYLVEHRHDFVARLRGIDESIALALRSEVPVCLLDMGDNIGGGGPGDSTLLAHALYKRQIPKSFVCLFDPESVQQAEAAGVGQLVHLRMGGKTDGRHGAPLEANVTVKGLYDGQYTETEVRHGGRAWGDLGRTAIVETATGMTIQLSSCRNAPVSLGHIRCCDLDPASFEILVAKGVVSPVPAYREVCRTFLRVNTSGATSADMHSFEYAYRRRPLFPFEDAC